MTAALFALLLMGTAPREVPPVDHDSGQRPLVYCRFPSLPVFGEGVYDFRMNDGDDLCDQDGTFGIFTGLSHPVTAMDGNRHRVADWPPLITLRSFSAHEDYLIGWGAAPDMPVLEPGDPSTFNVNDLVTMDLERIVVGAGEVGVRGTWRSATPEDLTLSLELVGVGTTLEDGAARVTITILNGGALAVRIGLRWAFNALLDSIFEAPDAAWSWVTPRDELEPYSSIEEEMRPPTSHVLFHTPRREPSTQIPFMFNFVQVLLADSCVDLTPPPTRPDVVQMTASGNGLAGFDGAYRHAFDYEIPDPPRDAIDVEATTFVAYWGRDAGSAIELGPGESRDFTLYFASWPIDEPMPASAEILVPSGSVVECQGPTTSLPLAGIPTANPATTLRWLSPDGSVTFDPSVGEATTATVAGLGTRPVEMLGTLGVFCSRETLDVTIQDTTPPALSVPPTVVVGTSSDGGADCQVAVAVTAEAWDTCAEGDVTITNDRTAGGAEYREELPVGTHEVTFTATDPSGNAAVETTTIQVVDDTPPTILLAAVSPAELWPPSHRMREVEVTLEVADNCDAAPRVTLVAVRSSEPADATGEGDGHTAVDVAGAELGTDDRHVLLRAERAGGGPGRTYALEYVVSDSAGNATPLTLAVVVPHDRSDGVRARAERMLPVRGAGTRPRR